MSDQARSRGHFLFQGPAKLHLRDGSILPVEVVMWAGPFGVEGEFILDSQPGHLYDAIREDGLTLEYRKHHWNLSPVEATLQFRAWHPRKL